MSDEMKPCQFCKEPIRANATTCPHCTKEQRSKAGDAAALGCGALVTWPFIVLILFFLYIILTAY